MALVLSPVKLESTHEADIAMATVKDHSITLFLQTKHTNLTDFLYIVSWLEEVLMSFQGLICVTISVIVVIMVEILYCLQEQSLLKFWRSFFFIFP